MMPSSITRHLHSKENRARTLVREWKTPRNAGKIMVLVEGWEDTFVYEQFFNTDVVNLLDCGGCDDAIGLNTCINRIAPTIKRIAIIDSDFRFFYGRNKKKSNVFFTDTHDMETMFMFNSRCFQTISNKLRCPSLTHKDIVKDLRLLSYIRWYNQDAKMKYKENGLDIVNMSQLKLLDYDSLIKCFTPSTGTTKQWLKRCFIQFKNKHNRAKSEHLINGHDYVDRLCHYARFRDKIQLSNEDVLIGIAESCDKVWFQSTKLFREINDWQSQKKIRILA